MRPLLALAALLAIAPAAMAADRVREATPLADPAPGGESGLLARILFTSNQLGDFEPCECPDLPLGGIAQAAAMVQGVRDSGTPAFWLDAGDRLFQADMALSDTDEAERRLRAILLVDAGSLGGLDAMGVGRFDLGAGPSYLRALARRAAFPVVSANLVGEDGEPIFLQRAVVVREGVAIGVTSVLPGDVEGQGFAATDPIRAARAQVSALREQGADLVVVLSNLGLEADVRLARATRADLVLGSGSRDLTTEAVAAGRASVAQAGSRGRYLGDARWYEEGKGRGPHILVTALPVLAAGPRHKGVQRLVEETLLRLADPVLGVPPLEFESWDDPGFRRRQGR